MPNTAAPYGLLPVGELSGQPFNGATRRLSMTTTSTVGIFQGDLVSSALGEPIAAVASPTTSIGVNTPVGVMAGCSYVDSTGKPTWSNFLPASAIANGATDVELYIWDDPAMLFKVQGSGAVTKAAIGLNAPLGNFGAGSTVTGRSAINLTYGSIATTATLAVRIVDVLDPATSYPDVIVKFNPAVHAYGIAEGR